MRCYRPKFNELFVFAITQYAPPCFIAFRLFRYSGSPGKYRFHSFATGSHSYTTETVVLPSNAFAGATLPLGHATRFAPGESGSELPGLGGVAVADGGFVGLDVGGLVAVPVGVGVLALAVGVLVG